MPNQILSIKPAKLNPPSQTQCKETKSTDNQSEVQSHPIQSNFYFINGNCKNSDMIPYPPPTHTLASDVILHLQGVFVIV